MTVNQELDNYNRECAFLPDESCSKGFGNADEARQQMLALIMAMANDPVGFEDRISAR